MKKYKVTNLGKDAYICDVELGGLDMGDYPDFADAYIESATWAHNSQKVSEEELDTINEKHDLIYAVIEDEQPFQSAYDFFEFDL